VVKGNAGKARRIGGGTVWPITPARRSLRSYSYVGRPIKARTEMSSSKSGQ
jgi:hypothetical protein